ncbi:hypothetical protein [Kitasatospora sp. MAA4]|uniref:hypothetical protein n=1 Tax=Kitasatospora sp. MAA4 TaxID=3035093 RepID=UPI002476411A|nr:hypothetical protein [Kitasatospora sp. MAA4]
MRAEISGITDPATFERLPDALAALWESMRHLPLDAFSADCFHYYLTRPDAAKYVTQSLVSNGKVELTCALPDGLHTVSVRPVGAVTSQ